MKKEYNAKVKKERKAGMIKLDESNERMRR